ncbi:solute carrier family 26 member 9-like, partial [Notothenia coriiceps]|uniref:Solute carrier family 26 member 9-like n=1 Tax=Notothenia coriiceps TaxID=8208 RepID=A0A6I9NF33_9TELE
RNGSAVSQIMDTDIYKNPKVYSKVISITGVKIVNYCSPLYFANAEMFRQRVIKKTGLDPGKLILARRKFLEKEEKGKEKEERKEERKEARKRKSSSLVTMKSQIISQLEMQDDFDTSSPHTSYVNFHSDDDNVGEQDPPPPTLELKPTPFHTLILDLPGVCFMDLTGINTLIK